ncbi:hypothetical protein [Microvirus mar60]|uniref:Uncharacterized protein n=1 Tax=Microvirus mar60 TaxID=2851197 RepID=A0A8F5MJF2_9VIRU|nr:hypothetical protein [Microvirus mar60]
MKTIFAKLEAINYVGKQTNYWVTWLIKEADKFYVGTDKSNLNHYKKILKGQVDKNYIEALSTIYKDQQEAFKSYDRL